MKREIEDDIANTSARVIFPVVTTLNVRNGPYNRFVFAPGKGRPWTELAKAWKAHARKEEMLQATGFMPGLTTKCVIVPVKVNALERPTIDIPYLASKLAAYGKKEGWGEVAVARSHWLNLQFNQEQYQQLVDGLEQKGLTVHEYE